MVSNKSDAFSSFLKSCAILMGVGTREGLGSTVWSKAVSSVAQLCLTLCNPVDCSTPDFPVHHQLLELAQGVVISIESVMPSNHPIPCRPLLLLPSVFPSIKIFSSESVLCIRWPKYWSFSFSISPPSEYSELISFRIDWFDCQSVP